MLRSPSSVRHRPVAIHPLAIAIVLLTVAGWAALAAAEIPRPRVLDHDPGALRVHVPVGAAVDEDGEPAAWHGLVAVPPGKRPVLDAAGGPGSLGDLVVMHGVRLAPLRVPAGADGVTLEIRFLDDPAAPPCPVLAETFADLLEASALGGAAVRAQHDEVPGMYLMIVPVVSGIEAVVEPLLDWRRRQGYTVQLASTLQTGTAPSQIKAYIQQVHDTAAVPLAHVCLVGDAGGAVNLATWRENVSGYNGEGDHDYVRLDGDDVLADAHIGRLTARSLAELEGIVAKILAYERTPEVFADPGWYGRAVLVGDPTSSGTSTIYVNQWLKEQLQPLGYTQIDTIWSGPFATQIFQKLNQGASVYTYRGYLGCSGFSPSYIDNLTNGTELPFAVMVTCASGSFASDSHGYSEAMLRNPHGGAIGAVGTATIGTHTRYNNCYFHGVWEGAVNEPDRALGYAHTRGKLELFLQYQASEPDIVEIWSVWNNLMGDPATAMRQARPATAAATYPATLPPEAGAVPVAVTAGGEPRPDRTVTLLQPGLPPVTGRTDAAGEVLLPLPSGAAPGELLVTVTGDDLIPHRGSLQLGAVAAHCAAVDWNWDDTAPGQDGDGLPDPGEVGALTVTVRNLGQSTAPGVSAAMSARTGEVEVSGGAFLLGDLPAGADALAGPWTVTLPADLADGAEAVLALDAAAGDDAWRSRVALPVSAPRLAVAQTQWSALPGQIAELRVTLENTGSVGALGAVATLTPAGGYLLPAGPLTVDLGDLAPGAGAEAAFSLAVSAAAWGGHLAPCRLTIHTATGAVQHLELPLPVGGADAASPVGPGSLGYLAWDSADPAADAPVYWWREIDPTHGGAGQDVGLGDFGYEQDDTRTLDLPFTFRFRGRDYDRISICSNGWVSLGQTYLVHWRNWGLPAAGAPDPLLAVFWDDLQQSGTNRVYHHHDAAAGIYVVQWSRMRNLYDGQQNCQVLLYDPAVHPTATGDGLIVYQYAEVNNNDTGRGHATVGLQDGQDGLTYTYYADYPVGARTLAAGQAIAWVPAGPEAPATAAVTPAAVEVLLAPGEQREVTVSLAAGGAEGAVLRWQAALVEPAAADRVRDDDGDATADVNDRTVEMVIPDGGEIWAVGESRLVRWDASQEVGAVRLLLDRGQGFETLVDGLDAASGSWPWLVTGPASDQCRFRVVDAQDVLVSDTSDGPFTITADFPWLDVGPLAGEVPAGETGALTVALDASGLAPGPYGADLVILNSAGEPLLVPIRLQVGTSTSAPPSAADLALAPAMPNPFNPRTTLRFSLPRAAAVQLTVHDLRGHRVRTLRAGTLAAGSHTAVFDGVGDDGRALPSGTYVARLRAGAEVISRRLTLVK